MKIGDYVRTDRGIITKIIKINSTGSITCDRNVYFGFNIVNSKKILCDLSKIIKSSPNIKSVIEEDDFANGKRVNRVIPEDICGDELLDYQHIFIDDKEIYEEDIKSIVTKEQFSQMEYKIESEVN